jgi:hypothetical protein
MVLKLFTYECNKSYEFTSISHIGVFGTVDIWLIITSDSLIELQCDLFRSYMATD